MLREDFLQQNCFTPYDRYSPLYKDFWMLRLFLLFHDLAQEAAAGRNKITWNHIKESLSDLLYKLCSMKFEDPADGENTVTQHYQHLQDEIREAFRKLDD